MFWIKYTDTLGNTVERSLDPAPTEIDYPETRLFKTITTQDGHVIVQRGMMDGRPRTWKWRGYGQPDANYVSQWTFLKSLDYFARRKALITPTIGIWEDTTGTGGFDKLDALGNRVYTTVKVLQVNRTPSGPGPLRYETSFVFYIEDPSYDAF